MSINTTVTEVSRVANSQSNNQNKSNNASSFFNKFENIILNIFNPKTNPVPVRDIDFSDQKKAVLLTMPLEVEDRRMFSLSEDVFIMVLNDALNVEAPSQQDPSKKEWTFDRDHALSWRKISKYWKNTIDKMLFQRLRNKLSEIPTYLGVRSIVETFVRSNIKVEEIFKSLKNLSVTLALAIGRKPKMILSAEEVKSLMSSGTDLHVFAENYAFNENRKRLGVKNFSIENIDNFMKANVDILNGVGSVRVVFNLTTIPKQIQYLQGLTILDLDRCEIRSIPKEIQFCSKLKTLFITDALLENIPEEICDLNDLERINLRGNKIKSIPFCLTDCKSLSILEVYDNPFERVAAANKGDFQALNTMMRGMIELDRKSISSEDNQFFISSYKNLSSASQYKLREYFLSSTKIANHSKLTNHEALHKSFLGNKSLIFIVIGNHRYELFECAFAFFRPITRLSIEIGSYEDGEIEVINYLKETINSDRKIIWYGGAFNGVDQLRRYGLKSLQDLAALDIRMEYMHELDAITFPILNWDAVEGAKHDLKELQKYASSIRGEFNESCKKMIRFIATLKESAKSLDFGDKAIDYIDAMCELSLKIEQLGNKFNEALDSPKKVPIFFDNRTEWESLHVSFTEIHQEMRKLELDRQIGMISSYLGLFGLARFWKEPENKSLSLTQALEKHQMNSIAQLFYPKEEGNSKIEELA